MVDVGFSAATHAVVKTSKRINEKWKKWKKWKWKRKNVKIFGFNKNAEKLFLRARLSRSLFLLELTMFVCFNWGTKNLFERKCFHRFIKSSYYWTFLGVFQIGLIFKSLIIYNIPSCKRIIILFFISSEVLRFLSHD